MREIELWRGATDYDTDDPSGYRRTHTLGWRWAFGFGWDWKPLYLWIGFNYKSQNSTAPYAWHRLRHRHFWVRPFKAWLLGAYHSYYNGPHCSWHLGPFHISWDPTRPCLKCMPEDE